MATIPTMHTFATGEVATASNINNNTVSAFAFLSAPPLCVLRQTVAQSVNSGTWTSILLDTEDVDRDGGHSTVTNTSRYTSQTAGWYLSAGNIGWNLSGAGRRGVRWAVNGTVINGCETLMPSGSIGSAQQFPSVTKLIFLNVGDYLEMQGFQDQVNPGATAPGGENQSSVSLKWAST